MKKPGGKTAAIDDAGEIAKLSEIHAQPMVSGLESVERKEKSR